jgi:hypothetical protein
MSHDHGAIAMHPLIPVRMIEMPMGVQQMAQWSRRYCVQGYFYLRFGGGQATINGKLAVAAGQNDDVAARTHQNEKSASEFTGLDLCSFARCSELRPSQGRFLGVESGSDGRNKSTGDGR